MSKHHPGSTAHTHRLLPNRRFKSSTSRFHLPLTAKKTPSSVNNPMNWTGGRLFRHSFKDKSTLKAREKLHFAKARRLAFKGRRAALSPLRISGSALELQGAIGPSTIKFKGKGTGLEYSKSTDNGQYFKGDENPEPPLKTRSHQPPNGHFNKPPRSRGGQFLEESLLRSPTARDESIEAIRRRLLQKNDWAGLSISRPLNVHFTTEEERYNCGRRRPLTEADRERLTLAGKQRVPIFRSYEWPSKKRKKQNRDDDSSTAQNLDAISIRINEQKMVPLTPRLRTESHFLSQASSESMLLDTEEAIEGYDFESSSIIVNPRSSGNLDVFWNQGNDDLSAIQTQETEELGQGATRLPSSELSRLPVLDRNGTFTAHGHQTKYIPPGSRDFVILNERHLKAVETSSGVAGCGRKALIGELTGKHNNPPFYKGYEMPKGHIADSYMERQMHPSLAKPSRSVFFGQTVEERADDFPNADEIWKRLVFGPKTERTRASEKLDSPFFASRKPIGIEDTSSISEAGESKDNITVPGEASTTSDTSKIAINTSINCAASVVADGQFMPSETDFLSQFSPKGGYIEEFLGGMSTYNNDASPNQSIYLTSPEAMPKKSEHTARFG
uniref:Uncharacterized protein n=1 Tax=Coccidioides posadasii RMSCC 3488 TaxID=454284 RepID=A0A0J6F8G1_COCPO|nr:hypothetical protein CPAG_02812 [Coccidioides posadasii RMSCC 3488]